MYWQKAGFDRFLLTLNCLRKASTNLKSRYNTTLSQVLSKTMRSMLLDLSQQRCPMALLMAKRHIVNLFHSKTEVHQQLMIKIVDSSSKRDIENYLLAQGYKVSCHSASGYFTLTVFNKEPS